MLELKQIRKEYPIGEGKVVALKEIDLRFRTNEFVSILGPSGCGKTTLLNIVGGLDQYTSGDLLINGVSTKEFNDRDWDSYRNHSVGFVFQTYNLIPHQTVLKNVEIALTLSGVSKTERRERAIKALQEVGLSDQIHKKPNEMSGGQMQRVAIARALVNNPDIILADEPTGALDTETSVQVMEILKEVAKDRLVVMVTHNPDLAEQYSSRIIRMLDGNIIGDSMPFTEEEYAAEQAADLEKVQKRGKEKKPSMSFWTAFKLSLTNLFTKKGRTTLTSFAGSIGIIGIALILAVSQGMTGYVNHLQETTLASYPLTLQESNLDLTSLMESFMNVGDEETTHGKDAIYKDPIIGELVEALSKVESSENDLKAFKTHLETQIATEGSKLKDAVSGIQYSYDLDFAVYTQNAVDGTIVKSDTGELMMEMLGDFFAATSANGGSNAGGLTGSTSISQNPMMSMMMGSGMWQEILPGLNENEVINPILYEQYELIDGGSWPNEKDEIVLIVDKDNELGDLTLYALGLIGKAEIDAIIDAAANGETLPEDNKSWTYEEVKARTYKTILPYDRYQQIGDLWVDLSGDETILKGLYDNATELKITGIIRAKEDADAPMLSAGIGYTSLLTKDIIEGAADSGVVQAQQATPSKDILTGLPFKSNTGTLTNEQKKTEFLAYVADASDAKKAQIYVDVQSVKTQKEQLQIQTDLFMATFEDTEEGKDALVTQIATALAAQMGGTVEQMKAFFNNMSMAELKAILRPTVEAKIKQNIADSVEQNLSNVPDEQKVVLLQQELAAETTTLEDFGLYYDEIIVFSTSTYEDNLTKFGCLDVNSPASISLYASSFEKKDVIVDAIKAYNAGVEEAQKISYTDYMGLLMSSITKIIDAITYVLIAFVSISLVVSSIMIGVITLISVQERTKEIGILRAIGASKRDVSSMFNAETLIIGFAAGLLGVLVTYLLCIPINFILHVATGVPNLNAVLPISAAAILVLISMALTLFSGLIPSRSAAKKDPVVALRTE
ncbi:MAG: ABC transporter ATP-binding protein/permease [Clostridia bacterium]|nr:ABC transporter ATP-binding protein/permease [Clostridia bacterium]